MEGKERLAINVARLKRHGMTFEVIIDPEKALSHIREGTPDLSEVLTAPHIYTDANKGMRASEEDLERCFATHETDTIIQRILKEGEIQLTAQQRQQIRERLERQVVATIARNAIDPHSKRPHPPQRIEHALSEAKYHVRENESVEANVQRAITQIRSILPLRLELAEFTIIAEPRYSGAIMHAAQQAGTIKGQSYGNDGSFRVTVELPAGLQEEFIGQINAITHGAARMEKHE